MFNKMEIALYILEDRFAATAHIKCPYNTKKQITFCLNNDLKISSVKTNGIPAAYKKIGERKSAFCSPAQIIEVRSQKPIHTCSIHYAGSVQFDAEKRKNFNNIITKDLVSLSSYSVWYPQELPFFLLQNKVTLKNGAPWFVLKAKYDPKADTWQYKNPLYEPYNIIAYRKDKLHIVSNPYMCIYTLEGNKKDMLQDFSKVYERIVAYYSGKLFKKKKLRFLDVALTAPAIDVPRAAYGRRGLLWASNFGETPTDMISLWAHETAHNWCHGANVNSWEDWLNETTAEWAALLFALRTNDKKLFYSILTPHITHCATGLPAIRTPDGIRPEGVHDQGTLLFYKIYRETNLETMENVLRCFTSLKKKTTRNFLKKLKRSGCFSAAKTIEENLDNSDLIMLIDTSDPVLRKT